MTTIKLDIKKLLGYTEREIADSTHERQNQAARLAGAKVGAEKRAGAKVGVDKRSGAKVGLKRPR